MNTLRHVFGTSLLALLALLLVSCSGSTQVAGGGTGGTGMSMGTVTGFGSVFVNGIEYNTDNATILVDGQQISGSERDYLDLGMVVQVRAERNGASWSATRVEYRSDFRGPVAARNIAGPNTFYVFDRLVRVTADTKYAGVGLVNGFSDLSNDEFVEVSGFVDQNGDFAATRVASNGTVWNADTTTVELRGFITQLNPLEVDGIPVDAALSFDADVGDYVHASGLWRLSRIDSAVVEREDFGFAASEGDELELEGIVTGVSGTLITVQGLVVETSGAEFNGTTLDGALGQRVEVEGRFESGQFVAEEVEAKRESQMEFLAAVTSINESANPPTIAMAGLTFEITAATAISDKVDFLSNLSAGDWVEIHGYQKSGTTYVATEAEPQDPDVPTLSGEAKVTGAAEFTIDGIVVHVDANSFYEAPLVDLASINDKEVEIELDGDGSTFLAKVIREED